VLARAAGLVAVLKTGDPIAGVEDSDVAATPLSVRLT